MSEFTVRGNIAGEITLFNEDDVDKARGFGKVYVDKYNRKSGKYDGEPDEFNFTGFGRDILNFADSIDRFIDDNDGKKPRVMVVVRPGTYKEEGENRKGEVVDKTLVGLTLVEGAISSKWYITTGESDGRAASKSGNRRRRKDDDEPNEDADESSEENEAEEEEEEEKPRARSGSRSRASGSRSRASGSGSSSGARSRAGGSRSRAGGSRRRG